MLQCTDAVKLIAAIITMGEEIFNFQIGTMITQLNEITLLNGGYRSLLLTAHVIEFGMTEIYATMHYEGS